MERKGEDKLII